MKILFSNLPYWEATPNELRQGIRAGSRWPFTKHRHHEPDQFRWGGYLPFPFFLGYAASNTKALLPDAEVVIRDSVARGEGYASFAYYLDKLRPDWIVIETATSSIDHDLARIPYLDAKVILCGPIDKDRQQEILKLYPNVHAIVQGEYDKQIARAVKGERGIYDHSMLSVAEMNAAPSPMWDEECATHYWDACPEGQQPPQMQIWSSRGCPFKCCFCVWPAVMTGNDPDGNSPRSVRFYNPDVVESHIRWRLSLHPYKSIYFDDDTFNLADKHALGISEMMKRVGLPWSAMCRADTVKRETWLAMKDSGCFGVKIGFESGSQYVIDHIVNKRLDLKAAEETCKWLQSIGIKVHTTWTVGLPGETPIQQQATVNAINRFYSEGAHTTHQLSGTATVDGTPLSQISKGIHLEKYDGAVSTPDFKVMGDGQLKIEEMTK